MELFYVAIVVVIVCATAILNVEHREGHHSNELEQYLKYESLTPSVNISSPFFKEWADCADRISQSFKNFKCSREVRDRVRNYYSQLAHPMAQPFRKENSLHKERFIPDCNYDLNIGDEEDTEMMHANFFNFTIVARNCSSNTYNLPNGGSSFEVLAKNQFHQTACAVRDNFDNSYAVYCPLSRTLNHHHSNGHVTVNNPAVLHEYSNQQHIEKYCLHLSVILDYEHFDAFSDVYGSQPPMNHQLATAPDICFNNQPKRRQRRQRRKLTIDEHNSITGTGTAVPQSVQPISGPSSSWVRRISVDEHHFQQHFKTRTAPAAFSQSSPAAATVANAATAPATTAVLPSLADYAWTGAGATFPTMKAFHDYFASKDYQMTRFVGDSHMRYAWDFFYYLYYGAEKLSRFYRKHGGSEDVPGLVLESVLFATDIADSISSLTCVPLNSADHSAHQKLTYTFQTGAWDLSSAPLRHFVRDPSISLRLLTAIHSLTRVKNCSSDFFRLVVVTIMPYPRCADLECDTSRGFRNNYAIAAANQWLLHNLQQVPSDVVYVVDAEKIVSARYASGETTCKNHFLCHPDSGVMKLTAAGVALAGEMLRALSWAMPGHADGVDCVSTAMMMSPHTRDHMTLREMHHQHHSAVHFLRENKSSPGVAHYDLSPPSSASSSSSSPSGDGTSGFLYHMIQGNVRRSVPDVVTYNLLKRSIVSSSSPHHASATVNLADFPFIAVPLPTRIPGSVLRGDSGNSEMSPPLVITTAGTIIRSDNSANCQEIFQMDINNIPVI